MDRALAESWVWCLNTGRHKYFDEAKAKYTHNLNLIHVHFGIQTKLN